MLFLREMISLCLDDLEACNNYQLDLNDLKNLGMPISIILGSKDRLVDSKGCRKFYGFSSKQYLHNE